jgi:hypothetical protein
VHKDRTYSGCDVTFEVFKFGCQGISKHAVGLRGGERIIKPLTLKYLIWNANWIFMYLDVKILYMRQALLLWVPTPFTTKGHKP